MVLTKELGPADFGHLSLFLAVTLGVSQLAGSWPFLAVPVLNARGGTIAGAFHPAARVAAIGSVIALLVAVPVFVAIASSGVVSVMSMCVYALALIGLQGTYSIFQTEGRMTAIAATQSAERAVGLVAMLAVVAVAELTVDLSEAILAITAAATCIGVFMAIERRHHLLRLPAHERHALVTVMAAVGAMAVASVCAYGVAWIDIYVLAVFRSNSDVGVYSLAYQIYNFTIQIGSLWVVATLPRHARSSAAGQSMAAQIRVPRLLIGARLWGGTIAIGGLAVGIALPTVFGSGFEDAVSPLMLLLSSTVLGIGYFAATPVMMAAGRTAALAQLGAVAVAVNLLLDLALVPAIGVNGPAIATIAQTVISSAAALTIAVGWRDSVRVLYVGLPTAIGVGFLALGPRSVVPALIAGLTALISLALGLLSLNRQRSSAPSFGPQP